MAFNGGLNSKILLKETNLAKIYTFRLLRQQSIMSSSFVEATPRYLPWLHLFGIGQSVSRALAGAAVDATPLLVGVVHLHVRELPYAQVSLLGRCCTTSRHPHCSTPRCPRCRCPSELLADPPLPCLSELLPHGLSITLFLAAPLFLLF
ncbi:hypothetical protein Syun_027747 [Stephania yunnanensis]|uniref:Uncharacterized protein n=1 Tax=Stephania yunnanensis TaxID=152371 RepID=A0AAP0HQH9_9MAGN